MKNLDLRNSSLETTQFEPFSIVLSKIDKNGNVTSALNFGHLKNNKEITIYMELLRYQIAESEIMKDFVAGLETLAYSFTNKDGKELISKGYNAKGNYISKSLKCTKIYTTDKDGHINNFVALKEGTFNDTLLNLNRCKGLVVSYIRSLTGEKTPKEFTNDLYQVASKVAIQATYFTKVREKAETITTDEAVSQEVPVSDEISPKKATKKAAIATVAC